MRVITHSIPDFRSVACGVFLPIGSVIEGDKDAGLSHFLEHLVFKGSPKYDVDAISDAIDSTGGEVNAYTSTEHTSFYFKVLKSDLDKILDILVDIVFSPKLQKDDIDRERGVVLSEIAAMRDNPDDLSSNGIFSACWGDHPASRPILGLEDVISNITPSEIKEFHKKKYQTMDAVISFCGGVEDDEIRSLLQKKGIEVQPDKVDSSANRVDPPEFLTRKYSKEFDSEQIYFTYAWKGPVLGGENVEKTLVANSILSGSYSSRLFRRLREKEGLVYSVSGFTNLLTFAGLIGVHGSVPRNKFQKMDEALREELSRFRTEGISESELVRSKSMIKGSTAISLEGNMAMMHRNGKLGLLLGEVPSIDKLLEDIQSIELQDLNDYILKTIPDDLSVSVVGKDVEKTTGITPESF